MDENILLDILKKQQKDDIQKFFPFHMDIVASDEKKVRVRVPESEKRKVIYDILDTHHVKYKGKYCKDHPCEHLMILKRCWECNTKVILKNMWDYEGNRLDHENQNPFGYSGRCFHCHENNTWDETYCKHWVCKVPRKNIIDIYLKV